MAGAGQAVGPYQQWERWPHPDHRAAIDGGPVPSQTPSLVLLLKALTHPLAPLQAAVNTCVYKGAPECQRVQEVSVRAGTPKTQATIHPEPRRPQAAPTWGEGHDCRPGPGPCGPQSTRGAAPAGPLPFVVQGHPRGVQVGVLHGLHLWTAQEVVERVEGVWGPGDGLGRLAGLAGGAGARAERPAALHVVHGAGYQVTCGEGGGGWGEKRSLRSPPPYFQGSSWLQRSGSPAVVPNYCLPQSRQAEVGTVT